jgi:hypothetical protein
MASHIKTRYKIINWKELAMGKGGLCFSLKISNVN